MWESWVQKYSEAFLHPSNDLKDHPSVCKKASEYFCTRKNENPNLVRVIQQGKFQSTAVSALHSSSSDSIFTGTLQVVDIKLDELREKWYKVKNYLPSLRIIPPVESKRLCQALLLFIALASPFFTKTKGDQDTKQASSHSDSEFRFLWYWC